MLLLPQTDAAAVASAAEDLRRAIGSTPFAVRPGTLLTVTVSIGASCLPEHANAPGTLVLTADHALYAAKEAGRDRTVTSGAGT